MPNLETWLADDVIAVMPASTRAALAWRRIQDRPTSITISRGSGASKQTLAAQVVRVESDNTAQDHLNSTTNTVTAVQKVTIFGIRDHATLTDTNIQRSDRFSISGIAYEVIALMTPPGEVQAVCEAARAS